MDLAAVAHLAAIEGRVPFLHFFDGFRTSHEIQKIEEWDYADLADMLNWDAVEAFRRRALNPEHPVTRGTAQNDDIFFQAREACNSTMTQFPKLLLSTWTRLMLKSALTTSRSTTTVQRMQSMLSLLWVLSATVRKKLSITSMPQAKRSVFLKFTFTDLSLPTICSESFLRLLRQSLFLTEQRNPGSIGEPLYLDVLAAINGSDFAGVKVYTGRYGLGSKDTTPGDIIAVYRNAESETPKRRFTIGIVDDVTNLSLPIVENPDTTPKGTHSCKFWGLGADGTVGANKNSIKIIGDNTDMYAQGYFAYDSKKSGGLTVSHLRFGKTPIKSTYYISKADFVACHNPSYVDKYDIVDDLKEGGSFLLNCPWDTEELSEHLPGKMKKILAERHINFYTIDGIKIGKEIGLGGRINTVLQSAFFKIADIIPADKAKELMKAAAKKSYMKKGQAIVDMNYAAIDRGMEDLKKVEIPADWANAVDNSVADKAEGNGALVEYVNEILKPVNAYKGNKLPVSTFMDHVDGTAPNGSAAYEKRGIAVDVPEWNPENCIQCNRCAIVCPHAVIRPVAMTADELAKAPEGTKSLPMMGLKDLNFVMTVSTLDCTGCGACAQVCPGKKGAKALTMQSIDSQRPKQAVFDYALTLEDKPEVHEKFKFTTVKGSQFKQPLLEFSGACAGCGETPYAKLVTQLFGDRMFIANATGCSSIWGASAPATPYTKNKKGYGPAWQNSLFEDNAEFGLGMALGQKAIRNRLIEYVEGIQKDTDSADLKTACQNYLDTVTDSTSSRPTTDALIAELEKNTEDAKVGELVKKTLVDKDELAKKSMWIFGGDGWAYDIGFGGLDHVIASGENVNILVFDTEVYSNTGGQASKATPVGSVAQFAAAGKAVKKKDLAAIAMSYGYVYVAQCAMGADNNQVLKAMVEAESYNGPSLVICYAPCINHGIKGGMGIAQLEEKKAVEAGYWNIFRYDPRLADEGKNPFMLDGKAPSASYRDFIMGEVRYNSLTRSFPERAEKLFEKAEKVAADKYAHLEKLASLPDAE